MILLPYMCLPDCGKKGVCSISDLYQLGLKEEEQAAWKLFLDW